MPRSYWRFILALVGLIAIGLAYLAYDQLQRSQIDPYPDAGYQPARNATFPPARGEQEAGTKAYDPYCQKPANKDDSDLCAQWSAVEAVNESNRLVRVSMWVTGLEFGALALSLIFTAWAAWAAQRAATAALQSVANEKAGAKAEEKRFADQLAQAKRSADVAQAKTDAAASLAQSKKVSEDALVQAKTDAAAILAQAKEAFIADNRPYVLFDMAPDANN